MQVQCPQCSSRFDVERPGASFCPSCGKQVDVPAERFAATGGPRVPSGGAVCVQHPDVAAAGICDRCGAFMCAACEYRATPDAKPICPKCRGLQPQGRAPTPWERRGELGWLQGAWQTWKRAALEPGAFWASVDPRASLGDAVKYAWLFALVQSLVALPFRLLLGAQMTQQLDQLATAGIELPPAWREIILGMTGGWGAVAVGAGGVVLFPLFFFIGAGLIHLFALIFGAGKNGFEATARAMAYASGMLVFGGIPYVGLIPTFYYFVLLIWGLARVQETTALRASFAVLGFPVLCGCCTCISVTGLIAAGVQSRGFH